MQEKGLLSDPSKNFGTFHSAFGLLMTPSILEWSEKPTLLLYIFGKSFEEFQE
jgi:hypothetical protein